MQEPLDIPMTDAYPLSPTLDMSEDGDSLFSNRSRTPVTNPAIGLMSKRDLEISALVSAAEKRRFVGLTPSLRSNDAGQTPASAPRSVRLLGSKAKSGYNENVNSELDSERLKKEAEKFLAAIDGLHVTSSVFGVGTLDTQLQIHKLLPRVQQLLKQSALDIGLLIPLKEKPGAPAVCYTTRDTLLQETKTLQAAEVLARSRHHYIPQKELDRVLNEHRLLNDEQKIAARDATGRAGLAIIMGEAGTGKSTVLKAIREVYEGHGSHVRALACTHDVVQDLIGKAGFQEAATVASEVKAIRERKARWTSETKIFIDETGLVSAIDFETLVDHARATGAKLILAGDHKQLTSIERSGMFAKFVEWFGASQLHEVVRVSDPQQKTAFNHMHKYEFENALKIFSEMGSIVLGGNSKQAMLALADAWKSHAIEFPNKSRIVMAKSNEDVEMLNKILRDKYREANGLIGCDHEFLVQFKRGQKTIEKRLKFAKGDIIQFRSNDPDKGFFNGRTVKITDIKGDYIEFTNGKNTESFAISRFNGIDHGYAMTIFRAQGKTFQQTYSFVRNWFAQDGDVAFTRHQEGTKIFAPEYIASNYKELAKNISKVGNNRAATQFLKKEDDVVIITAESKSGKKYENENKPAKEFFLDKKTEEYTSSNKRKRQDPQQGRLDDVKRQKLSPSALPEKQKGHYNSHLKQSSWCRSSTLGIGE